MNLLREKKKQAHSRIRREHLKNYFQERRLEIARTSQQSLNQDNFSHKQFLEKMLDKSQLQGQILKDIRQFGLLDFLKQKSKMLVNNSQCNDSYLITKKYILALCSNILKQKITIDQKEAILIITLPLIQSFLKNNLMYRKSSIFKAMGTQIFSFYINSIMAHYFYFDQQQQLQLEYLIHIFLLALLNECFNNPQPNIVYQDIRYCLMNFLSPYQQDDNLNKQKLNRNVKFIMQIILIQSKFIQLFHQNINNSSQNHHLPLHASLFQFYRKISYSFTQIPTMFNCDEQNQTLKLIMFGFRCLSSPQIKQNCMISIYNILRFKLLDQDQMEQLLIQDKFFQFILIYIQNMKGQIGLFLLQQLVRSYLQDKKFKKLIQQYSQFIIDICRAKLQCFQDIQVLKASLKIICLLFIAGAQNLTVQVNLFLIYFNSLNGKMLLQEIQDHFSQTNQEIKEMLQIITYNSVEIESSQTILQKFKIDFIDFSN